ncbi:MAG: alpha/beta hydrolase [Burkholderiaceae bacterium]
MATTSSTDRGATTGSAPALLDIGEPVLRYVSCAHPGGLHRMAYWEWGRADNPDVVVCVHGLTRTGRDFDVLASRLARRFRVVCPDVVGRGASDRFGKPDLYTVPIYVADMVTLVARLGVESVDWVGTSMGGIIGMVYAATPGNPIRRLVLNDIGPEISEAGLQRIGGYVGEIPTFASFDEAERAVRQLIADFGPLDDAQFRVLSRHYIVERDERWTFHYDPAIAQAFHAAQASGPAAPLWPLWDAIQGPALVVRGSRSDILSAEVAQQMTQRGPRAQCYEVDGVGHAPSLIPDDQVAAIERFLS